MFRRFSWSIKGFWRDERAQNLAVSWLNDQAFDFVVEYVGLIKNDEENRLDIVFFHWVYVKQHKDRGWQSTWVWNFTTCLQSTMATRSLRRQKTMYTIRSPGEIFLGVKVGMGDQSRETFIKISYLDGAATSPQELRPVTCLSSAGYRETTSSTEPKVWGTEQREKKWRRRGQNSSRSGCWSRGQGWKLVAS